jgi:hypothetical protein
MLPYCGRPLLEGLLRDLTAREYLYYSIFGVQHTTPVAIMTSDAKGNDRRVRELLAERSHFGRPQHSFRLFCQPLVPVLEASSGLWVLPQPLTPNMKPGGHGAIWKLMHDNGVFEWLEGHGVLQSGVSVPASTGRLWCLCRSAGIDRRCCFSTVTYVASPRCSFRGDRSSWRLHRSN